MEQEIIFETIWRLTEPRHNSEFINSALERADFVLEDAVETVQTYKLRQDKKLLANLENTKLRAKEEDARLLVQMSVTSEVVDDFGFALSVNHNKSITYRPINYPLYGNKHSRAQD